MGESIGTAVRLEYGHRVHLEFHGASLASDVGPLACPSLDEALGLTESVITRLHASRGGRNVQPQLQPMLRQSRYSRVAGYEDTNDAERLAQVPAM